VKTFLPSFFKPKLSDGLFAPKGPLGEDDPRRLLTRLAEEVVARQLSVPAVFFLELMKPLAFLGSQTLVFFGPFLTLIFPENRFYSFTELIEEPDNVEFLIREIERLEGSRGDALPRKDLSADPPETANKKR